jgi:23S rRNA (pseudouridine1915-N3)-methyltransferase
MRTTLLLTGKTTDKHIVALMDDYIGRIGHYMPFTVTVIPELKNTKNLTEAQQKEREGELILKQLKNSDLVWLLDERGKQYSSVEFSDFLQKLSGRGRDLVFVIGGAYGFSKDVYSRADGLVSLSKMTFSHQMVRTVFAEQLYRAFTIIRGEPYHHE